MAHAKVGAIGAVLIAGLVISQAGWGWFIFDSSGAIGIVGTFLLAGWLLVPFVAVALAIADGEASRIAIAAAFAVAVVGSLLVRRLSNAAIEDDPSSTASLIHLYDPLVVVLAVGAVFGLDYVIRRLAKPS